MKIKKCDFLTGLGSALVLIDFVMISLLLEVKNFAYINGSVIYFSVIPAGIFTCIMLRARKISIFLVKLLIFAASIAFLCIFSLYRTGWILYILIYAYSFVLPLLILCSFVLTYCERYYSNLPAYSYKMQKHEKVLSSIYKFQIISSCVSIILFVILIMLF